MNRWLVGAEQRAPADKRRGAVTLAALAFSGAAQAITLGDAQVRSFLGQPLEARIPVSAGTGDELRGACFSLAPRSARGIPALTDAELALRRSARGNYLEVRSRKPIQDPDVLVSIAVACPGREPAPSHDVSLLLDPPLRASPPLAASSPVRTPPPRMGNTIKLGAHEGDTLQSIARAMVPGAPAYRADYLAALRDANPALAAGGDDAPIAPGVTIALPDLRTYARTARHGAPNVAHAAPRAPRLAASPGPAALAAPPLPSASPSPPRVPANAAAAPRARSHGSDAARARGATSPGAHAASTGPAFQLKLSSAEIDLSASRNIGERERAQLRERLAMLDADDQVAAMLSLRHSLKQLEARVAELQLKLATISPTLEQRAASTQDHQATGAAKPMAPAAPATTPAAPAPAPVAAKAAPGAAAPSQSLAASTPAPSAAPAPSAPAASSALPALPPPPATITHMPRPASDEAATAAATPAETAKATAPALEAAKPAAPVPAPAPPRTAALPAAAPASSSPAPSAETPRARPHVSVASDDASTTSWWLWAALAVVLLALAALVMRWRRSGAGEAWLDEPESQQPAADEIAPETAATPADAAAALQRVAESDADLPTRLPTNDAEELRRRYMAERFPELASGMIKLDDAPSVVKAARLLYEDGAAPRAVELLQFALETHPGELRHWLALFEIYRLERLTGEYAALAHRFQIGFGETEHWQKVCYFGREIDPSNPLYKDPLDTLQTIGPRESRRLAAASSFDPLAENWLNAPMDFENEVLANELRNALMQKAAVTEHDLAPNPMPALRHVEMFTVA
ncbi:MAG TPA: hypothetical protein VFE23_10930 [Usitatibacter sp.]|nr:hypothetical protein [Usitatibacter sp.]